MDNLKQSEFPRGSEWRRWDLHVHTPESKLGDSFTGTSWEAYLTAIEKAAEESKIAVIGVTDYMTIDGYEKILSARADAQAPRLQSVQLVLPNIEFRATPPTKDNKALNIHLLVDPSDPDHVDKIKRALKQLRYEYDGESYGCYREQLIEFGQKLDSSLDDAAAYRHGIEQFKPSYEVIEKWLAGEKWLRDNSLVGIANGKDGISGLPLDGFSATRDKLLRSADFVFSGNPKDREHYLGQKEGTPESEIVRQYGSLKPCVHGSDAHAVEKLFVPDQDRYCWIKADPTFEGLKQVLWEPEARVSIGKSMPQQSDSSRVITSLKITASSGWFTNSDIPINSGLVAIIGEKGSGKTAVADLVAYSSGAYVRENSQSSFIEKARLHLNGLKTTLEWESGSVTSAELVGKPFVAQRPLVRYLSQDFVEQLCSNDHEGHELQEAIEEVVFAHLEEARREGFSSFSELRASRESASQAERDALRGALASSHREIERAMQAIEQVPSKSALKAQAEKQVEELKKQLPQVEALADKEVLKKLEMEKTGKLEVEQSIAEKSREKRGIEDIAKSYALIKERTTKQIDELIEAAKGIGRIPEDVSKAMHPDWNETVEAELAKAALELDREISELKGPAEGAMPDGASLVSRDIRIKALQESLSKDELNRKRLLDLQKQIAAQEATVSRITKEIADLEGKTTKQLAAKMVERGKLYAEYFVVLKEDGTGLHELYAPMKSQLDSLGPEMKFELSAGYRVDTKDWLDRATRFYDGRKPAASAKKDDIEKFVLDSLAPAWKSGDDAKVAAAFDQFYVLVDPPKFMREFAAPSLKLVELFDWMYATDHISVSYKILYGGIGLENLSPGTRGIALLVLYLLMDADDRRPLIIDQPEGNLDNASVYEQLVPYIKRAKEKRQIILVTHNPNLVVATDAEQIIVAVAERPTTQAYPSIRYHSGSIEHASKEGVPGIRQAICTLLEGGKRAFKDREERYSIRD